MLVSGLVKLAIVPVTVPALLSTGIGKVVSRLKRRDGEVGRLTGELVSRWKRIALQYEEPQPLPGDGDALSGEVTDEPDADLVQPDKQLREVMSNEWVPSYSQKKNPQRNARTVTNYCVDEDADEDLDDSINDADYKNDENLHVSSSAEDSDENESIIGGEKRLAPTSTRDLAVAGARLDTSVARKVSESGLKTATVPGELVKDRIVTDTSDTAAPEEMNVEETGECSEVEVATNVESDIISDRESALFSCKLCKKKYASLKCFLKHQLKCGKILFSCNICQTMFKSVRYLKMHVKNVHKEPRLTCEFCELKLRTPSKLKSHLKTHSASKCIVCEKSFKNGASLRAHRNKVHNRGEDTSREGKIWSCTFCTKKLTSERGMRYHITLHKTSTIDDVVSADPTPGSGEDEDSVRTNMEVVDLADIVVDTVADNIIVLH